VVRNTVLAAEATISKEQLTRTRKTCVALDSVSLISKASERPMHLAVNSHASRRFLNAVAVAEIVRECRARQRCPVRYDADP